MATKESMMNFISGSPKQAEYQQYEADAVEVVDTAPKLEVLACPAVSSKKLVIISGTLIDEQERDPHLFINQKEVVVRGGKWLATINLTDGINHIVVVAYNNTGKHAFVSRDVFCGTLPLRLEVDPIPDLTFKTHLTVTGKVIDLNSGNTGAPEVSVNGHAVDVDEQGKWSFEAPLSDGENILLVIAKNNAKTATTVKKVCIKGGNLPELRMTHCPESSPVNYCEIKGILTKSPSGKNGLLKVGDQPVPVAADGSFTAKLKLKQSNPPTTFTVIAETTHTIDKQINFDPPPPVITVTKCEPGQKRVLYRVSGTAVDEVGSIAAVIVNGKEIMANKGAWSTLVNIKFGYNPLDIIVKNSLGKISVVRGGIFLEKIPPVLEITEYPAETKDSEAVVKGIVKDPDGERPPMVLVNDVQADLKGDSWKAAIPIEPGINEVKVAAISETGKTTIAEAKINCLIIVPSIKVLNCPRLTDTQELILRGFARSGFADRQNDVKVFINSKQIEFADGKWTHTVMLEPGENQFSFAAENEEGKRAQDKRTVTYRP